MKNMNTTLEIPEGSKATIQGKVIDGKNYLVVEVEQEPELKQGDFSNRFEKPKVRWQKIKNITANVIGLYAGGAK